MREFPTNNAQDPTVQTRELREYCQRRGWEIAGEYVDAGISGTKERRPQLDASWLRVGREPWTLLWSIAMTVLPGVCASL